MRKENIEKLLKKTNKKLKEQRKKISQLEHDVTQLMCLIQDLENHTFDLNARIRLCCDTTSNWMKSTKILLKGEAAVEFPDEGKKYPVRLKIGDGEHKFSELSYVSIQGSKYIQFKELIGCVEDGQLKPRDVQSILCISSSTYYDYRRKWKQENE